MPKHRIVLLQTIAVSDVRTKTPASLANLTSCQTALASFVLQVEHSHDSLSIIET